MRLLPLLMATLLAAAPAWAQHRHEAAAPAPACAERLTLACARVATPAFGADGALWLAWAQGGHVWVGRSADEGATFTDVAKVNPAPQAIDDNGENRPKLAMDGAGRIFVTYAVKTDRPYSGDVLFSRSLDGGRSFSVPRSLAGDGGSPSLRFETLGVAPGGRIYAAWIDKRRAAAAAKGAYRGATLAVAWSDDGGKSFGRTVLAQDHTCECCRMALAFDADGLPVLAWRNIFAPNLRDHAVMKFAAPDLPGDAVRIADDSWAIDACPHHGPGLAVGEPGVFHVVWFTQGQNRRGLFYARSDDAGRTFSAPMGLGDAQRAPTHAHVAAIGRTVAVAWKEFTGEASEIMTMTSRDGGNTWSAPKRAAHSAGASDHPLLIAGNEGIHLSWLTRDEGYRLIPVVAAGKP